MEEIETTVKHFGIGEDKWMPMPHTKVSAKTKIKDETYGDYIVISGINDDDSQEVKESISVLQDKMEYVRREINGRN